ncbi:hypothetical protein RQP46_000474 [Phenoliferia psychrophenolica]
MLDPDREDVEWDESLREDLVADRDRAIRPLPKRQRLHNQHDHDKPASAPDPEHARPATPVATTRVPATAAGKRERTVQDAVERDSFDPVLTHEPALERRNSAGRSDDDNRAVTYEPPPRARPQPPVALDPADADADADADNGEPLPRRNTFRATDSPHSSDGRSLDDEGAHDRLFGVVGSDLVRSLASASAFSDAGLFGGLGLAALHPSLAPPSDHLPGEEDEDEEGYSLIRERSYAERSSGVSIAAGGVVVGNNKKKRKIPGINLNAGGVDDDDRGFDGDDLPEPTPYKAPGMRSDFASDLVVNKAPSDTPKTAKAALAKLRVRPPHVSLSRLTSSSRRQRRRYHRSHVALQKPLPLPPPVVYVAPISYSTGPPPLPPGSGLKGSRALKAAKKAEKDREREKERIKQLLGGDKLKLLNLWDPLGHEAAAAKALRRRGAEIKSGYLTPPASSEDGDSHVRSLDRQSARSSDPHTPPPSIVLDEFAFAEPAPLLVATRWKSLLDQIESLKVAKERAAKAREEEAERKKEKERDAPKEPEPEQPEVADAAGASKAKSAVRRAPGQTAPTGKTLTATELARQRREQASRNVTANVALHPGVEPINDRSSFGPPSTTTTSTTTVEPMPLSRKPPLKKGRKKRSAHANANNVHHRDNFVPSRVPGANSSSSHAQTQHHDSPSTPPLTSWPASQEAIAAAGSRGGHDPSYFAGQDEWLCMFCEYEIFYGEESLLSKAIRNRKKILKIRQKARDRASKAANGPAPEAPAPAATA